MENTLKAKTFIILMIVASTWTSEIQNNARKYRSFNPTFQLDSQPELFFEDVPEDMWAQMQNRVRPPSPSYGMIDASVSSSDDYDTDRELQSNLPYGIQNVRDVQGVRATRNKNRMARVSFQTLCPSKRETVFLNLDSDFEYRPDHYEEVTCVNPYTNHKDYRLHSNKVCGEAGFSCIQLNRTVFLTRRLAGTSCWDSETRLVAAGCECMWPKHHFGDIITQH